MSNVTDQREGFADLPMSVRIRSIFGGAAGNMVEWFDWLSYSIFALYFSHVFFPEGNQTVQLMSTAAVFAAGHLVRPLGAIFFGWYADRKGRRAALSASVLLMCAGSLLIALNPGYAVIGIASPALLVVARLLQGISVGGEYGSSAAYMMEVSPPDKRGFFVSLIYTTLLLGQLLAILLLVLLQYFLLTPEQLHDWGWRVPFVIGGLLGVVAMYIRRGIIESPEFENQNRSGSKPANPLALLLTHPKEIALVFGLTMGGALAANTFNLYMPKYLVNTAGFTKEDSTLMSLIMILSFMLMQPVVGALSDKVGRRPILIAFGLFGSLLTVPIMGAIADAQSFWGAFGLIFIGLVFTTGYTATNALVKAELFPVEVRAAGIGIPFSIATAMFGGTAEFVALKFKDAGWEQGYFYYISVSIAISMIVYIFMRETAPNTSSAE
jgi:MFS transporter, MHS family, alpha-ketoglutarate permease